MSDREFFLSIGICPICRKNKLFGDERSCPECKVKQIPLNQAYYQLHGNNNEAIRKRYAERKAQGICTRCGKRKAQPLKAKCGICQAKENARNTNKTYYDRISKGLCALCGHPSDGKVYCESCREKTNAKRRKAI